LNKSGSSVDLSGFELKLAEIGSNANVVEGELVILVAVVVAGDVNINNTVTKTFALF